ncbi:MAG TPA: S53 family peptidase [Gammaproteobacteria bacterium]|nr:S53 family peptidase [Gammaproteobacteria bacterium]
MNIGKRLIGVAVATALAGGMAVSGSAAAAGLVQVQHNVSPVVARASMTGHHDPRAQLDVVIALKLRNTAQLTQFVHDLNDPASPNYRKFLTAKQFTRFYGPSQAQVDEVLGFLKQRGIAVDRGDVSKGRTRVHFHATTAVLESAFGVAINDYTVNGRSFYAAATNPNIPASLANRIGAVMGLDNAAEFKPHSIPSLAATDHGGLTPTGFSPNQIATAYHWPSVTDANQASGVNIAIVTAFTYRPADIKKFWDQYGLPHHTLTNIAIGGVTRRLNGETTLDVERSSAMAPGAGMLVYEAVNPAFSNFDLAFQAVADDDTADVVSTSWGLAERDTPFASLQSEHNVFVQLSAQGMPLMAAAGDNGAPDNASSGSDNADFPSSDPLVTAAGGTSLFLNGDDSINSESAWSGAGGADSMFFTVPAYQSGFTGNAACDADHTADFDGGWGCTSAGADTRQSSDMAMNADPGTGYSVYYNGRWATFGGTSFVAPELAGFFAIVTARYRTLAAVNTVRIGNANTIIYDVANGANYSTDFNDITTGSNGFAAGAGWDHPTGWGTPKDADALANDLANDLPL